MRMYLSETRLNLSLSGVDLPELMLVVVQTQNCVRRRVLLATQP